MKLLPVLCGGPDVSPPGELRIAFYIPFWDSSKMLTSSYDDVLCLVPTSMPERLEKLVPYDNVS